MNPIGWIEELLFPRRCPMCDRPLPFGTLLCPDCAGRLTPVREPRCFCCGKPLRDARQEYCGQCRQQRHIFDRGLAAFPYDNVKASLYRFKYEGRQEYAACYAQLIMRFLGERIRSFSAQALVPIPLHPKRQKQRGYNQALLLAKELGKLLDLPVYGDLLIRTRNTTPLKRLNREERQNNLKKAFKMRPNEVKLDTIILIDDIYTTGSTMDAAAAACREAGVLRICFVTFAVGEES